VMRSRLASSAVTFGLVLVAGAIGFRLNPDSGIYASGRLLPNSLAAGFAGRLGGMPLLVLVSAIAAAAVVYLLPDLRARLLFFGLGGFWLLFPGADALGVLGVAFMARRARAGLLWPLTGAFHLVSALVTVSMLSKRFSRPWLWSASIGVLVMVVFTLLDRSDVPPWEHFLYVTRYLVPASYLYALNCAGRKRAAAEGRPTGNNPYPVRRLGLL
jgi:hypothetical protein